MKRALAIAAVALLVLVAGGAAADSFTLTVVSQNSTTITFSYPQQSGYGYLYSANGTVVSRTNDPSKTQVKFAKASTYEVAAIVKGAIGSYPTSPPPAACVDGIDNDGDTLIDYPADPGCTSSSDTDEANAPPPPPAACANGLDDDSDGKIDYPADPGCSSATDTDETDQPPLTGFPDASNTGVPSGTTLTAYTGPSNVTVANTVIDGKTIGCITVSAPGVVIRNSRISCGGGYAVYVDDRTSTSALVTVEDSEIDCKNSPGSAGIGEADFVARRVEITGCENGFDINQNALIEDSYIHDLYNGGESHLDGAQLSFGHWNGSSYPCCAVNVTFRHNTMYGMGDGDTSFGTSAIISNPKGDVNILIDNNLLAGGAYTLYCDYQGTASNYRVTNNHFSTRFKSTVGFYGLSTGCADETQSGNLIHETGQAVTLG